MDNPFEILEQRIVGMECMLSKICSYIDQQNKVGEATLISGEEARHLFKPAISKSTLQRWTNDGLISKYRLGGKVMYKKTEIESAAKKLRTYKTKSTMEMAPVQ